MTLLPAFLHLSPPGQSGRVFSSLHPLWLSTQQQLLNFVISLVPVTSPNTALWLFCLKDRASLCSPGYSGGYYVDQDGLELKRSSCLYVLSAGTKGVCHHAQPKSSSKARPGSQLCLWNCSAEQGSSHSMALTTGELPSQHVSSSNHSTAHISDGSPRCKVLKPQRASREVMWGERSAGSSGTSLLPLFGFLPTPTPMTLVLLCGAVLFHTLCLDSPLGLAKPICKLQS